MLRHTIEPNETIGLSEPMELDDTLSEFRQAIAAAFFEDERAVDVRHLWTRGQHSYFRVNWWSASCAAAPRVRRSAFVMVETHAYGYRVRDVTCRPAA